jgi:hypothetical protein
MLLVFGQAHEDDVDSDVFVCNKGGRFYMAVEGRADDGDITIMDSIGREVPVAVEDIPALIRALQAFHAGNVVVESLNADTVESVE